MLTFSDFLEQIAADPTFAVTAVLTLAVILVNGWTDAPNAIATCVANRRDWHKCKPLGWRQSAIWRECSPWHT